MKGFIFVLLLLFGFGLCYSQQVNFGPAVPTNYASLDYYHVQFAYCHNAAKDYIVIKYLDSNNKLIGYKRIWAPEYDADGNPIQPLPALLDVIMSDLMNILHHKDMEREQK